MLNTLLRLDPDSSLSLKDQLRQKLVAAVLSGTFGAGRRLPSSRKLAADLGVARNTVTLAYQQLVDEGYLVARERSGLYVNAEMLKDRGGFERVGGPGERAEIQAHWSRRLKTVAPGPAGFRCPPDWQSFPYPFIDGRFDRSLFPVAEWREANRLALGMREIHQWSTDSGESDDPKLIEEIRTKILPRRGISAQPDEILLTMGPQQALHLLTELLVERGSIVGLEEPGSPEMRDLLLRRGARIASLPVDSEGLVVDAGEPDPLSGAKLVYVTPGHQQPTAAVMSQARRRALLAAANATDAVIIEEDIEFEINDLDPVLPALRSGDGGARVIYVAGLSKALAPSLRLGFMVAPQEVIAEARRLRQLTTRHPPLNNQRTAALFLALGHYDAVMVRLGRVFRERITALHEGLNHYLSNLIQIGSARGGTNCWVTAPEGVDARLLAQEAESRGILIEPVDHYFAPGNAPTNVFRLGITSLPANLIRPGVAALAEVLRDSTWSDHRRADRAQGVWLTGTALRDAMSGATLLGKTVYGQPCTIEVLRDGSLLGRAGYANEDRDTGRWWIEGDRWYRHWEVWAYNEPSGYHVLLDGDRIGWFNADRVLVDTGVIVRS